MSSTSLFPYRMMKGQWVKADELTESDIAVIIDMNSEIFWFWEGSHSTARDRYNARQILGQLRKKYTSYLFKRINEEAPEEVVEKIEMLQIHALAKVKSEKKNKFQMISNIFYAIRLAGCIFIIIAIALLSGLFFQFRTIYPNLYIDQNIFISILQITSLMLLISFVLFIFSAAYMGISRKNFLLIILIIGCCLVFTSFFMIRIWDVLLIYEISDNQVILQDDAGLFFMLNINVFLVLSIICGFLVIIMDLLNVSLERKKK